MSQGQEPKGCLDYSLWLGACGTEPGQEVVVFFVQTSKKDSEEEANGNHPSLPHDLKVHFGGAKDSQ